MRFVYQYLDILLDAMASCAGGT